MATKPPDLRGLLEAMAPNRCPWCKAEAGKTLSSAYYLCSYCQATYAPGARFPTLIVHRLPPHEGEPLYD